MSWPASQNADMVETDQIQSIVDSGDLLSCSSRDDAVETEQINIDEKERRCARTDQEDPIDEQTVKILQPESLF